MLNLSPSARAFLAVNPVEMRGSLDALAGAVRRLGLDPRNSHLYLFLSKIQVDAESLYNPTFASGRIIEFSPSRSCD